MKTELDWRSLNSKSTLFQGNFIREMNVTNILIVKGDTGLEIRTTVENDEFFQIRTGFLIRSQTDGVEETTNYEFSDFKDGFSNYDDEEMNKLIDWKKLEPQWKELFKKALYNQTLIELGDYFRKIISYNIPNETILRVYEESLTKDVVEA
jgi:hypothetical protein